MKVKKLRLKNGYKRFHDLTIDLGEQPKKIVVLVGPNGCGKSSVLDGMLFHSSAHVKIGNTPARDNDYHSLNRMPNYNYQNVELELDQGIYTEVYAAKAKIGKASTIFSFRSPYRYNSKLKVTQTQAVEGIELNKYGASTASDLDGKMEENYRRLYIKYNRYLNEKDCTPSQAKAHIIGQLNSSLKECLDLEISSIGSVEESKGSLYFRKPDHPTEFDFNVLSSGEKEVVDIVLDLFLRKEEYSDTIFLLDEPELHINTSIQRNLMNEIDKLIPDTCQLWIATHSIGFLRTIQEELKEKTQIIHFKSDQRLASNAYTMTPIVPTTAAWRELFEIALDDITKLVCPRRLIYCEGRDRPSSSGDERGLDARVLNNIFSTKYQDTLFISSGGSTELEQRSDIAIAILGKVLPDLEVLLLKDRDMASGKLTTQNDRDQYLANNEDHHRVLKRWEIENYLYDKEVLKAYCDKNNLNFEEQNYDDFVKDIVNQNLKDSTGRIKNFCGIKTSINSEQFKVNLSACVMNTMDVYSELESDIF